MGFSVEENLDSLVGEQIDELVSQHNKTRMFARSSWKHGKEGKIYLRASRRLLGGKVLDTIDLATVELHEEFWGKGVFSQVLAQVERKAAEHGRAVFVENVLNPIIDGALRRRGYCRRDDELSSYWKTQEQLRAGLSTKSRKSRP